MLQIAAGHRSLRYNTDLPPPSHSKLFLQALSMVFIASNFDKRWKGGHKHKIMDRLFKPKYGTVSQVLLQLVVPVKFYFKKRFPRLNFPKRRLQRDKKIEWHFLLLFLVDTSLSLFANCIKKRFRM